MNRDQADAFAMRLTALAGEGRRADRALIKRARTGHPTQRLLARRVLHSLVPPDVPHTPWTIDLVERVAGLYVVLPDHRPGAGSIGAAARRLASRPAVSADAVERRFQIILAAGPETVSVHAARLLARCAAEAIGLDFGALTWEMERVGHPDRYVERRWADDFWGSREVGDDQTTTEEHET